MKKLIAQVEALPEAEQAEVAELILSELKRRELGKGQDPSAAPSSVSVPLLTMSPGGILMLSASWRDTAISITFGGEFLHEFPFAMAAA